MNSKKLFAITMLYLVIVFITIYFVSKSNYVDYSNEDNWAIIEDDDIDSKDADIFFIAPTVYLGSEVKLAWTDFDADTMESFVGSINMEKGIYDDNARFFAPYYHQASLCAYYVDDNLNKLYFDNAYKDVRNAFEYYIKNYNNGRPFIIAGFSQGGEMAIRLIEEYAGKEWFDNGYIATYAIGWRFTEEDQLNYPNVKFASGEDDTGCLIAFSSEAPEITDSIIIQAGTKTLSINPLNWKTSDETADKSMNLGACFTDYSGDIYCEIPDFTGAYIDEVRGALKVTDVDINEYPGILFEDGIYHLYDYEFFYRNLEQNVQTRIEAFISESN